MQRCGFFTHLVQVCCVDKALQSQNYRSGNLTVLSVNAGDRIAQQHDNKVDMLVHADCSTIHWGYCVTHCCCLMSLYHILSKTKRVQMMEKKPQDIGRGGGEGVQEWPS